MLVIGERGKPRYGARDCVPHFLYDGVGAVHALRELRGLRLPRRLGRVRVGEHLHMQRLAGRPDGLQHGVPR